MVYLCIPFVDKETIVHCQPVHFALFVLWVLHVHIKHKKATPMRPYFRAAPHGALPQKGGVGWVGGAHGAMSPRHEQDVPISHLATGTLALDVCRRPVTRHLPSLGLVPQRTQGAGLGVDARLKPPALAVS